MRWILLLALAGCGHTRIETTDPAARIYVDGAMVGKGHAEIRRTGVWHTAHIEVKTPDGRHETREVRREFTWGTLLCGLYTVYLGFIFCAQYPDTVLIALPAAGPYRSPWDVDPNGAPSVWDAPPSPKGEF